MQLALLTLQFDQLASIAGKHDPYSRRAQRLKAKHPIWKLEKLLSQSSPKFTQESMCLLRSCELFLQERKMPCMLTPWQNIQVELNIETVAIARRVWNH